ncbi:MAG: hypothetical protein Q3998_00475 [Porphyromonas sp.]|nr:hypothetical protein [Porphyromonas sp.]
MRKIILILALCLASFYGHAQSDPKVNKQVQAVRMAYNKAGQSAEQASKAKEKENYMALTMSRNMPGNGLCYLTSEFFFLPGSDEDRPLSDLYLVRTSWNYATRKFYREFLFYVE